jgi:hypothetical protein
MKFVRLILAALAVLMTEPSIAMEDDSYVNLPPPFSAEMVSFNERNARYLSKTRVVMSRDGVRLESHNMFGEGVKGIFVQNFADETSWMIKPEKRIFSQLPKEPEALDNQTSAGGIMATKPCQGYNVESDANKIVRLETLAGEEVVVWECGSSPDKVTQYFNTRWLMVVKETNSNNDVVELRNLRKTSFQPAFFRPSGDYREVSLHEFFVGVPELDTYLQDQEK